MNIKYQSKVAPSEASCCFLSPSSRPRSFLSPNSKHNQLTVSSQMMSEQNSGQITDSQKKKNINAMKKSISSISLKRKCSDGYRTNRTSMQISDVDLKKQKKPIKYSMDSEHLKNYLLPYEKLDNLQNTEGHCPFDQLNKNYSLKKFQSLDQIAFNFEKERKNHKQPSQFPRFKKKDIKKYNTSEQYEQEKGIFQRYNKRDQPNQNKQYETTKYEVKDFKKNKNQSNIKNPEQSQQTVKKCYKYPGIEKQSCNYKFTPKLKMNQVDSMIISVKGTPKRAFQVQDQEKNRDRKYSLYDFDRTPSLVSSNLETTKKFQQNEKKIKKLDLNTSLIHSDFDGQQQIEGSKTEKIEQSAIIMNFFHPPSFIKDKLGLSKSIRPDKN